MIISKVPLQQQSGGLNNNDNQIFSDSSPAQAEAHNKNLETFPYSYLPHETQVISQSEDLLLNNTTYQQHNPIKQLGQQYQTKNAISALQDPTE
jgi:hypothetical protein